jgi:hypothetical protein
VYDFVQTGDYYIDFNYFDVIELFIYDKIWKAKLIAKLMRIRA